MVSLSFSSKVWSLFISSPIQAENFIEFQIFCSFEFVALYIPFTNRIHIKKNIKSATIIFNHIHQIFILPKKSK
jgi:hypothetical protein